MAAVRRAAAVYRVDIHPVELRLNTAKQN